MPAKNAKVRIHQSVPVSAIRGATAVVVKRLSDGRLEVQPEGSLITYPVKSWQVSEIEES